MSASRARTRGLNPLLPRVRETLTAGVGDRGELDCVRQLGQVRHVVAYAQRHLHCSITGCSAGGRAQGEPDSGLECKARVRSKTNAGAVTALAHRCALLAAQRRRAVICAWAVGRLRKAMMSVIQRNDHAHSETSSHTAEAGVLRAALSSSESQAQRCRASSAPSGTGRCIAASRPARRRRRRRASRGKPSAGHPHHGGAALRHPRVPSAPRPPLRSARQVLSADADSRRGL